MSLSGTGWMTGSDDDVRAALKAKIERLRGCEPHEVFDLAPDAGKPAIRAAFLQATKQFHPNLFARRERDVVKLANEVFLLLKDAHAVLNGSKKPRRRPMHTNPLPAPPPQAGRKRPPRDALRTNPLPAPPPRRPSQTSNTGQGARPPARPSTTPGKRPKRSRVGSRTQPISVVPPPTAPQPGTLPPRAKKAPRTRVRFRPGQPTDPGPGTAASSPAPAGNSIATAMHLLETKQWNEAANSLESLVAARPGDRLLAARLHYARAKRHEKNGNLVDANIEYRRAVEADPDFDEAKRAVRGRK